MLAGGLGIGLVIGAQQGIGRAEMAVLGDDSGGLVIEVIPAVIRAGVGGLPVVDIVPYDHVHSSAFLASFLIRRGSALGLGLLGLLGVGGGLVSSRRVGFGVRFLEGRILRLLRGIGGILTASLTAYEKTNGPNEKQTNPDNRPCSSLVLHSSILLYWIFSYIC